MKSAARKRW